MQTCCPHILIPCLLSGWCLAASGPGVGREKLVLGLEPCVAMAIKNHPRIVQANASVDMARAQRAEAKAAYWPRIDADAKWQRLDEVRSVDVPLPDAMREAMVDAAVLRKYTKNMDDYLAGFPFAPRPPTYSSLHRSMAARLPKHT